LADPAVAVDVDATMVEIEAPGGLHWNSGWQGYGSSPLPDQPYTATWFGVDKGFFEKVTSSPVKLHIWFALTLGYGRVQTHGFSAFLANSNIPSRNGLVDLQSEPDMLRLRSIPALSQILRHCGGLWEALCVPIMRKSHGMQRNRIGW
jgi:hypothetical protein